MFAIGWKRHWHPEPQGIIFHSWYLTDELVPFCLFDSALKCVEKGRVAKKAFMVCSPPNKPNSLGKRFWKANLS